MYNGKEVNHKLIVVLHIDEAINLNLRCEEQLVFKASLGGNILETNIIPSKTKQSEIRSKLIWETDRESIKRLKTKNCPIRLECYSLQDASRRLIGFNLISIRNTPILAVSKALTISTKWQKLQNLSPEWTSKKPEISFFLIITDAQYLTVDENETFCIQKADEVPTSENLGAENENFEEETEITRAPANCCPKEIFLADIESLNESDNAAREIPRTFCYYLVIETVNFSKKPEHGIWQIIFFHPKAVSTQTIQNFELTAVESEIIYFENLRIGLFFSAEPSSIFELIQSENSVLTINGPGGRTQIHAELNNECLILGSNKQKPGIILMENSSGTKTAVANIYINLEELGINFNSQMKNYTQIQPQAMLKIDENLTYKCVEELEQWKSKQEEMFLVELKQKEKQHLSKLTTAYGEIRAKQEQELAAKLENFSSVVASLESAHKDLKQTALDHSRCDQAIAHAKHQMQHCMKTQLLAIKEKLYSLECDKLCESSLHITRHQELSEKVDTLATENEQLKQQIAQLQREQVELKENPQSIDQHCEEDLKKLHVKLVEAQNSKMYYKEQWVKVIREMHKMKSVVRIPSSRHESDNPYLEIRHFLNSEYNDLHAEAKELQTVKQFVT